MLSTRIDAARPLAFATPVWLDILADNSGPVCAARRLRRGSKPAPELSRLESVRARDLVRLLDALPLPDT
jgi:hypothetical protein